jgi:hypothetical protein
MRIFPQLCDEDGLFEPRDLTTGKPAKIDERACGFVGKLPRAFPSRE